MAQKIQGEDRIGGRYLIQEQDHNSGIVRANEQTARQADQGQATDNKSAGERRQNTFSYENPRQVH